MDAQQFKMGLRFVGGMPTIIVRDHTPEGVRPGRLALFRGNERLGTVIPGHMLALEEHEAVVLSIDNEEEMRGSWSMAQHVVSVLQQTGSWASAWDAFAELDDPDAF